MPATYLGAASQVDINGLLAHTTQYIEKKGVIQDALFGANQLFHEMKKNGNIRTTQDGGYTEQVNLLYGKNNTFGSYSRYDVHNNDPQDGMGAAYFGRAQYSITISIDGMSLLQNAGSGKIKDLVGSKMEQATMTIADEFNKHLWDAETMALNSGTGNSGKNVISLPMLVDADPDRSLAIGGLNPATYSWWRNNVLDYGTAHTKAVLKQKMIRMYMTCQAEGKMGGPPDLIIMDPYSYENYEMSVEDSKRYTDSKTATAGFENMYFKNAKIVWDDKCPDPHYGTLAGANAGNANWAHGAMYFLNTKFLGLRILGGRDWKFSKWTDQIDAGNNQDAKQTTALWAGQLITTNRRKHGVIYQVDDDIIDVSP